MSRTKTPSTRQAKPAVAKAPPSRTKSKTGKPTRAEKTAERKAAYAAVKAAEKRELPPRKVGVIDAAKTNPNNPLIMKGTQTWDKDVVMEIVCSRIATRKDSLVRILREDYEGYPLPDSTTIRDWIRAAPDTYDLAYRRAKSMQAELLIEEIIDIADDGTNDYVEREVRGGTIVVLDNEHVQRSRLRIDTRKFLAAKLLPRIYGDFLALTGAEGGPIKTQSTVLDPIALSKMSPDERRKLLESMDE